MKSFISIDAVFFRNDEEAMKSIENFTLAFFVARRIDDFQKKLNEKKKGQGIPEMNEWIIIIRIAKVNIDECMTN